MFILIFSNIYIVFTLNDTQSVDASFNKFQSVCSYFLVFIQLSCWTTLRVLMFVSVYFRVFVLIFFYIYIVFTLNDTQSADASMNKFQCVCQSPPYTDTVAIVIHLFTGMFVCVFLECTLGHTNWPTLMKISEHVHLDGI